MANITVTTAIDTLLKSTVAATGTTSSNKEAVAALGAVVTGGAATGLNMSTARILGRTTASAGAVEEITVGSGLSLTGGNLTATGTGALTSAQIFVGNGSNVATAVAMSGDIAITNTGVTSIASGAIVDADISATAAINVSKLTSSSATAGFVLTSSGTSAAPTFQQATGGNLTSGPVTSSSGVSAIADTALTIAKTNGLQAALDAKQATLVSLGNIRTVNGNTLLGTTDLVISAGGNLTSGPVTSSAGVSAIADAALTIAKTSGLQTVLDSKERSQQIRSRIWKWRSYLDSTGGAAPIALLGDSMIDTAKIVLRDSIHKAFGMGGYSFLQASPSAPGSGAEGVSLDFANWFTGSYVRLASAVTAIATVNVDTVLPIEANTLKIFYVTQPGGGTFKIQTRRNSGTWTNEDAYLNVSTSGTLAGSIITITKTEVRSVWEIRAVWVSGGNVDIIGGALYDTSSAGARIAMLAVGNTNMVQWITASSAVCQPIIANIAPKLCILSHLDGASDVVTYQSTFQDTINTWSATSPTWLIIGSPVGCTDANDIASSAQIEAQITLADSRFDAFWDNRAWARMTAAQAISAGFLTGDTDPHLTTLAQQQWIPLMLRETGIAESYKRVFSADVRPAFGAAMRRDRVSGVGVDGFSSEIQGSLRLCNPPGTTGNGNLILEDRSGANNSTSDQAVIFYDSDLLYFNTGGGNIFTMTNSLGDYVFTGSGAVDGSPVGYAGHMTAPLRGVVTSTLCVGYVEKTANYTLGTADYTVNVTANSPTITLPLSANTGGTTRNKGRLYVVRNTGAGTVQLATSTVTRSSGVTNGTTTITFASNGLSPQIGELVTGTNIPAGTYVTSLINATSCILSAAATGSSSGITFTFSQAIDSGLPTTVVSGGSYKVQSTGYSWITIP